MLAGEVNEAPLDGEVILMVGEALVVEPTVIVTCFMTLPPAPEQVRA